MRKYLRTCVLVAVAAVALTSKSAFAVDCLDLQNRSQAVEASAVRLAQQQRTCDSVNAIYQARALDKQFWEQCYQEYGINRLQANEKAQLEASKMEALKVSLNMLGCR